MDEVRRKELEIFLCSELYELLNACNGNANFASAVLKTMADNPGPDAIDPAVKKLLRGTSFNLMTVLQRGQSIHPLSSRPTTHEEQNYLIKLIQIYVRSPLDLTGLIHFFEMIESANKPISEDKISRTDEAIETCVERYFKSQMDTLLAFVTDIEPGSDLKKINDALRVILYKAEKVTHAEFKEARKLISQSGLDLEYALEKPELMSEQLNDKTKIKAREYLFQLIERYIASPQLDHAKRCMLVSERVPDQKLAARPTSKIAIKTLDNKLYQVEVNLNETVFKTKQRFFAKSDILPSQLRLLHAGRALEDAHTLADYQVREDSTLNAVLRLRGD